MSTVGDPPLLTRIAGAFSAQVSTLADGQTQHLSDVQAEEELAHEQYMSMCKKGCSVTMYGSDILARRLANAKLKMKKCWRIVPRGKFDHPDLPEPNTEEFYAFPPDGMPWKMTETTFSCPVSLEHFRRPISTGIWEVEFHPDCEISFPMKSGALTKAFQEDSRDRGLRHGILKEVKIEDNTRQEEENASVDDSPSLADDSMTDAASNRAFLPKVIYTGHAHSEYNPQPFDVNSNPKSVQRLHLVKIPHPEGASGSRTTFLANCFHTTSPPSSLSEIDPNQRS